MFIVQDHARFWRNVCETLCRVSRFCQNPVRSCKIIFLTSALKRLNNLLAGNTFSLGNVNDEKAAHVSSNVRPSN